MGLKEQLGLDAVTKSLHDPFGGGPKAFNKVVVRSMTQPEKEPENLERASEVPAKLSVIERPASPPPPSRSGRPTTTGKPWESEGISRQAWYKRQKKSAKPSEGKGEV